MLETLVRDGRACASRLESMDKSINVGKGEGLRAESRVLLRAGGRSFSHLD